MAGFRRRGFRRRRFGGRSVKRKEPVWITTAYEVSKAPLVTQQDLFELVGPEDYTPDYVAEPQRMERSTVVRTVGSFTIVPILSNPTGAVQRANRVVYKAALFTASDAQVEAVFANDPGQYDIIDSTRFPIFCRDYAPMHIFWFSWLMYSQDGGADYGDYWVPPTSRGREEWDVTVKRRMKGDEGLWLLINSVSLQNPVEEIGHTIDVESRNLLND